MIINSVRRKSTIPLAVYRAEAGAGRIESIMYFKQVMIFTMDYHRLHLRLFSRLNVFYGLLLLCNLAYAGAREIDGFRWEGVERIVAIGDLHGDYENYLEVLRIAGLINKRGKWSGGKTHLVQTGDIPDRGPDSIKIIEHISKLARQAKKKGGRVHSLIGNHEAMNMYGDLRYVHPGEFKAFVNRNSAALRDRYFAVLMQNLEAQNPERFTSLPENYRTVWNVKFPLGWVEHRQAWNPAWNPEGEFATWVLENKVSIKINDAIFLHGGISAYYCQNSLESITEKAHASLRHYDFSNPGIIVDEFGPLWYRGLSGVEPHALSATVDAILEHQGVRHIVVGHSPTNGVIWPRYDAKVVMIDTGISHAYGSYLGYLEITPEGLFAGYPSGKLPLPSNDEGLVSYLEKVIEKNPDNPHLQERVENLLHPDPATVEPDGMEETAAHSGVGELATAQTATAETPAPEPIPICGISP